ncbi:hypothetical protein B0H10DRAFT_2077278, partial [Mycena sp. CBHHK59/15]
ADAELPAVKRPRWRPRGSTKRSASATPAKAKTTAKPKAPKKADQENIPPPIELADSDDEIERSADGKVRYWKPSEKTRVFTFILGLDTEGERRFNQHKTNPGRVYKRASEIEFEGDRSPDSSPCSSMRSRPLGGCAHSTASRGTAVGMPTQMIPLRFSRASSALHARPVSPLAVSAPRKSWSGRRTGGRIYSIIVLEPVRRSRERQFGTLRHPFLTTTMTQPAPRVQQTPAATVSEPKHTPSSNFRKQVTHSFGNLGEIMKMKMVSEEKKASVLESRLNLDREKLEMDKTKGKVEMAHTVLSTPGASDEVKEAANAWLLTVFSM